MRRRYSLAAALAVGVAIAACGGGETPQAPATAKPATPAPSGIPVACIAKWASGPSGKFACTGVGPDKDRAKITAETLRINRVCVNDPRLTSITVAGGNVVHFTPEASGVNRCAALAGAPQLPETCTCVPPAGGDCTGPAGDFVCVVLGRVS